MKLQDILSVGRLCREIDAGYVTERYHPEFGELAILNYTDKCQYDQHWNEVTRATRGLIYNRKTGKVVARGLPKFFNYGDEANTGKLDPDMRILSAHDKVDGSLGIGYLRPDGKVAIATRGSFTSEQAIHATEVMDSVAVASIHAEAQYGRTPLWEIIYPENRIVLDYGERDELVHLGSVENRTGGFYAGRTSMEHDFLEAHRATLRDVLEQEPRKNAEGYVIWLSRTEAIKLKQDDYMALHRIVSNLTVKEVWRHLRAGTFQEFIEALPDEFHEWADEEANGIGTEFNNVREHAGNAHSDLMRSGLLDRRGQALWIQSNVARQIQGLVFGLLDRKDISDAIWRMIEPKGAVA